MSDAETIGLRDAERSSSNNACGNVSSSSRTACASPPEKHGPPV